MREIHVSRTIDAPAGAAWELLTDVRRWPEWGPSVRSATVAGGGHLIGPNATGSVATVAGVRLPYRVTSWDTGRSWSWDVASLPATSHAVRALDDRRCEVSFGVPWFVAPYAAVCRIALRRIASALER
jgi:hypothetical protein